MDKLFLDIETLPQGEMIPVDELKGDAPKNYKNPEAIEQWAATKSVDEFRSRGLKSTKGRIFCISCAFNDGEVITFWDIHDEEKLLKEFNKYYLSLTAPMQSGQSHNPVQIVGHNIEGFDLPWLIHRGFKYRLSYVKYMPKKSRSERIFDTMKEFGFTDYRAMHSLKDICYFFGIPIKTELSGDKVYDAFLAEEYDKIVRYCEEDVKSLRKVYKAITL